MAGIGSVLGDILYNSKTFEGDEERYVAFPRDKPAFRVVLNVDKFYPQNVSIKFINEGSKRTLQVKMIHDSRIERPPTKLYQYAYKMCMDDVKQAAAGSSLGPSLPEDQSLKDAGTHSTHDELRYSRDCSFKYELPDDVEADSLSVVWTSNNFLVISSLETTDDIKDPDSENYRVIPLHVACDDSPRIDLYSFRSFAREVLRCARDVLGDVEDNLQLPEGQSILDDLKELNFLEDDDVIEGRNNLTDAYLRGDLDKSTSKPKSDAAASNQQQTASPDKSIKMDQRDMTDFVTALNMFRAAEEKEASPPEKEEKPFFRSPHYTRSRAGASETPLKPQSNT